MRGGPAECPPRTEMQRKRTRWPGIRNHLNEDAGNDCPGTAFILSFQTAACVVIPTGRLLSPLTDCLIVISTGRRERRNLHKSLIFVSRKIKTCSQKCEIIHLVVKLSRSNFAYHRLSGIVCRRVICNGITQHVLFK